MTLAFSAKDPGCGGTRSALAQAIARHGVRLVIRRDTRLYVQDEPVDRLFRVIGGVVRTTRLAQEGRRQVGAFYYPGDILGLETGHRHLFSAEALSDVEVQALSRRDVGAFAGDPELDRAILDATRLELERAQRHMLMLGLGNAREKVAAFLLGLASATPGGTFELAMGRQDIADYLGLTIETVSRTLGQLRDEALVEFPSARRFRVPRWAALEALAA